MIHARNITLAAVALLVSTGVSATDILTNNDGTIRQSLCVGLDCTSSESFGFDTVRLKENNTQIHFEDTSVGSFPTRDWLIQANSTANGGPTYLRFFDVDTGRAPFVVEGNAPSNSLYVDDGGRVGIGTAIPVLQAHIADGNTPGLRLQQDNSSGFSPQTWDVAGNEANFFVRDVTGGSQLPFRIIPGADTNSLVIASDNDIGIGTLNPDSAVHVVRNGETADVRMTNSATDESWEIGLGNSLGAGDIFTIGYGGTSGSELRIFQGGAVHIGPDGAAVFRLNPAGNLTIDGTLTEMSDVNAKTSIVPLNIDAILQKLTELPLAMWSYRHDPDTRHVGPMAQDFFAMFGLGASEKHIATMDTSGIALAASQALAKKVKERDQHIENLESRLAQLEKLVASFTQDSDK